MASYPQFGLVIRVWTDSLISCTVHAWVDGVFLRKAKNYFPKRNLSPAVLSQPPPSLHAKEHRGEVQQSLIHDISLSHTAAADSPHVPDTGNSLEQPHPWLAGRRWAPLQELTDASTDRQLSETHPDHPHATPHTLIPLPPPDAAVNSDGVLITPFMKTHHLLSLSPALSHTHTHPCSPLTRWSESLLTLRWCIRAGWR